MNGVVKYFMERNKVIVQYVYDDYGYRYGCVVAIGPGRIGWSMVHHTADSDWKQVKPWQLPAIQKMQLECTQEEFPKVMIQSPVYKRWLNTGGLIKVPYFNRNRALAEAIDKALNMVVTYTLEDYAFHGDVPRDTRLIDTIYRVNDRSLRANWPELKEEL